MPVALPVVNLAAATFDCTFGRGCDGLCCRNGRPSVDPNELATIRAQLPRLMPMLRPAARDLIEHAGFVSRRIKEGKPMVRVADGWCVFFNRGCVLHVIGAEDGESYRYKPVQCALFPLDKNETGDWYVRQWDYEDEQWDLFCLNPQQSKRRAAESLAAEIELAAGIASAQG